MGPEATWERALKAAVTALGWLALAAMLALASTGVQLAPAPESAGAPVPLAADR